MKDGSFNCWTENISRYPFFGNKKLRSSGSRIPAKVSSRPVPHRKTIQWNVRKFKREGTVRNIHKERCGRHRTGRSVPNVAAVRQLVANNGRVSCRNNTLGLPSATFNRIVRLDLSWHPYRIFVRHELKPGDLARRLHFCRWFCNSFHYPRFVHNILIGDEC